MAPNGSLPQTGKGGTTARSAGGGGSSSRHTMKKGPWTSAEDAILMEYVKKHGEGNWNAVQRNSGLMRCGKSCRLRWANHLRPNLKKGAFSMEEENLIVQLHAKFGNKWARMASQLPGRTDNEIKNYWNTRLKRRQRAGLPIYPFDIKAHQNHLNLQIPQTNPSSSSLVSLLSSSSHGQKSDFPAPLSIFDMFISTPTAPPPQSNFLSNLYLPRNSHALSQSSVNSPFSPPPSATFAFNNQGFSQPSPMPSLHFNSLSFGIQSRPVSGSSFEQDSRGISSVMGLPSIHSLVQPTTTTASSAGSDHVIGTSSSDADDQDETLMEASFAKGNCSSGLLEDLLGQSRTLATATTSQEVSINEPEQSQGNFLWDYKLMEDTGVSECEESGLIFGPGNLIVDQNNEDHSSPDHSSIETPLVATKKLKASSEEADPVDDDLLSLLDNFPLTVPVPEWYEDYGNVTNGPPANLPGSNPENDSQPEYSSSPAVTTTSAETTDHQPNWSPIRDGTWKNLPGIY